MKIPVSPQMARFNAAVDYADWFTNYKYDRRDVLSLARCLREEGCGMIADNLVREYTNLRAEQITKGTL